MGIFPDRYRSSAETGIEFADLLDCKANIDFAYQLYQEKHGFTPWSTYNSGKYREFLASP